MFYNGTNERFDITWDKFPYSFEAGSVNDGVAISTDNMHSVQLTPTVCEIFARHLATKVLNDPSINKNFRTDDEGKIIPNLDAQRLTYNMSNMDVLVKRFTTGPLENVDIPESISGLELLKGKDSVEEVKAVVAEAPVVEKKKMGRPPLKKSEASPEAVFDIKE